jgi:hypothetical protein
MGALWCAMMREREVEWLGDTCLLWVDGEPLHGVVMFQGEYTVGMFYTHEFHQSERNPWPEPEQRFPHDLRPYLRGMPLAVLDLAITHAFPAFDQFTFGPVPFILPDGATGAPRLVKAGEMPAPIMTTCFWGVGDRLTAAEPWPEVYEHGLWGFDRYLIDPEQDFEKWRAAFNVPEDHACRLLRLWHRRLATGAEWMPLVGDEVTLFFDSDLEDLIVYDPEVECPPDVQLEGLKIELF